MELLLATQWLHSFQLVNTVVDPTSTAATVMRCSSGHFVGPDLDGLVFDRSPRQRRFSVILAADINALIVSSKIGTLVNTLPEVTRQTQTAFHHRMVIFWCALAIGVLPGWVHGESRPNVLLILADDLGWSDTTLFGTTSFYRTPNIERLAARGMTFRRAYADSPLCSPTRASVLTGLSPARHGITAPNCHLPNIRLSATATKFGPEHQKATIPDPVTRLSTDYYTLAEMFRDNGYATGHFGKWHLGAEPYSPLEHGFDIDVPHHPGPGPAGSYVAPWAFKDFDHDPEIPNQHLEDRMAREAVAFLEQRRDEPFFMNYWMFSVHAPFDAKPTLIEKYREQVDANNPQRSPTYAAMIESMDDAVGTLLDTLDRLEIANNTVIVFASDNGGNMYNEVDGTSATSNAPLRGGKATMYEGGVRGPAIFVDPKFVKAGARSDEVIQTSDFYPTLLELLDIDPQPQQTFDGISIVPALKGESLNRHAIFTYFPHSPHIPDWLPPAVSVHSDDWKLIRIFYGGDQNNHDFQLFNLRKDIGEQENLAAVHPERVRALDRLIENFLADTEAVVPVPNPRFDPAKYQRHLIGKAALKGTSRPSKRATREVERVAGWQPGGTCVASVKGESLIVQSDGGDPYVSYSLPKSVPDTPLILKFTMESVATGDGQLFWQVEGSSPRFAASRSKMFVVHHDGRAHEYSVQWSSQSPVQAVRIDPAKGKGRMILSNMRLTTEDGMEVYRWRF